MPDTSIVDCTHYPNSHGCHIALETRAAPARIHRGAHERATVPQSMDQRPTPDASSSMSSLKARMQLTLGFISPAPTYYHNDFRAIMQSIQSLHIPFFPRLAGPFQPSPGPKRRISYGPMYPRPNGTPRWPSPERWNSSVKVKSRDCIGTSLEFR